ncbi:MAG: LPS export ABC transporter permease LptF [Burkholderiales bacterium]
MLIKKVFYRELVSNATKIFVVLIFILPVTELFKLLNDAASGNIPTVTLITLMIYGTIASFPMILTIACFLTVVITINRYCKDHEFVIWLASGVSPAYWLKQTAIFILPMTIICAVCSMYITPWATVKSQEYANFLSKQQTSMVLAPGIFKENHNGDQVFYIENYSLTPSFAKRIFIVYNSDNATSYNITAKAGSIENNKGITSVILEDGHRYELDNNADTNILLNFKQFKASIKQDYKPIDHNQVNIPTSSVKQLIEQNSNHARAELSWRISIAMMMFVMACIAVPISIQTGRVQNSLIFIVPPIIYAIYENCILTLNGYIGDGKIPSIVYVFIIHFVILLLAIWLTYLKSLPTGYLRSKNKS